MTIKQAIVSNIAVGTRLDVFAQQFYGAMERYGFSRSAVQKLISSGCITVNGARAKPSARLRAADVVELACVSQQQTNVAAEPIPLSILYEDDDCIVINKPPGIVVHPAAGNLTGTLVNALVYHCPKLLDVGGDSRPGIVHRLDKDTSGVMVVAKNNRSLQRLARQFKDRTVKKEYVALVWGKPDDQNGIIDRPVGRHRSERKKMSSVRALSTAREAVTEWSVERAFKLRMESKKVGWVTLLRLKPRTGRTHQIRVHLADWGHAIVGDKVYGHRRITNSDRPSSARTVDSFPRQALHAETLSIEHPTSGDQLHFQAPLYSDIEELLDYLTKGTSEDVTCDRG